MRTLGGSSNSMQTEYADMVFEDVPFRYNVLASVLSWVVLAGFLVLPTTFPEIEMIMKNSHKMDPPPELRSMERIPLYVPFTLLAPRLQSKSGPSGSLFNF